jgi:hypothetical protein
VTADGDKGDVVPCVGHSPESGSRVQVHFLWLTVEMPVVLLLFLTVAEGFVLGVLTLLLIRGSVKPQT